MKARPLQMTPGGAWRHYWGRCTSAMSAIMALIPAAAVCFVFGEQISPGWEKASASASARRRRGDGAERGLVSAVLGERSSRQAAHDGSATR